MYGDCLFTLSTPPKHRWTFLCEIKPIVMTYIVRIIIRNYYSLTIYTHNLVDQVRQRIRANQRSTRYSHILRGWLLNDNVWASASEVYYITQNDESKRHTVLAQVCAIRYHFNIHTPPHPTHTWRAQQQFNYTMPNISPYNIIHTQDYLHTNYRYPIVYKQL